MGYNIAGDFGTERKLLFLMSFVFVLYMNKMDSLILSINGYGENRA